MKIAVTYDAGEIFQHFGHSEQFKVYVVEGDKVVSSEIVDTDGQGHGALAALLEEQGIEVLICGGIGGGAQAALSDSGIEVCSGASGDADAAVEAYLKGELESEGVNCDHHGSDSEEEGCGSGCGSDCGSHCGGGCGGCHAAPSFDGKNVGKTIKAHYRGTFNDGTEFDSSYDRGEPLEFVCGAGMMILGFDKAVANMEVGEVTDIHLMPSEAYGEVSPEAILKIEIAKLPGSENLNVGDRTALRNMYGQAFRVTVTEKDDTFITLDANHEMAGKELNFRIEIVEIND